MSHHVPDCISARSLILAYSLNNAVILHSLDSILPPRTNFIRTLIWSLESCSKASTPAADVNPIAMQSEGMLLVSSRQRVPAR